MEMYVQLYQMLCFSVDEPAHTFPGGNHATSIVEGVGMFLFALYHIAVIIVLVNMLIAMMSHSFEDIQVSISTGQTICTM